MEHFFMPVMKMQERHLQAIGQPVPDDVMKAAKKDPENWYVEWYKGQEPHYFINLNEIDYVRALIIED